MQDVIFVSLELGIHYIWIDLLCIFQDEDDITDWQQESALMNKVYSNTFCNISAGDANGCLESLFNTRDADSFLPQVIELQVGRGDHKTQLFRVYDLDYWRRSISGALVNKRGWVLQERFLSARVLQFDKRQVLWECLENCATETCPEQIPRHLLGRDHRIFKNMVNPTIQVEVRHLWTCLVQEYTACDLTVPSDKLVAISGIAKHIAALLQDRYVVGMWRACLQGQLLWRVRNSHFYGKTSRPAEYRAPSWSWASIDGPVAPGSQLLKHSLIKVEEVHLEYLTDDVYGAVTRGWIRLRGALRQLQLVRISPKTNRHSQWDMFLEGVKVVEPAMGKAISAYPLEVCLDLFHTGFEEENANNMLFAMFARKLMVPQGVAGGLAMLLLRVVEKEKAIFERIGFARVPDLTTTELLLKAERPTDAPAIPCLDERDGMHSICII